MVKSSTKGKAGEKYVVELLKKWWRDERFMRNWMGMSGAVGTQIAGRNDVPPHLLEAMTGDIITPADFPFSVESKFYKTIDLYEYMRLGDTSLIGEFWKQCKNDAMRIGKIPLVILRENRKQAYCMFPHSFANNEFPYMTITVEGEYVHIATWENFSTYFSKERVLELLCQ